MKNHIKIYLDHFGYGEQSSIPSEISSEKAQDIHHIIFKSQKGKDEIKNLMAVTREEHDRLHFKKKPYITEEQAQEMHNRFLKYHTK